MREAWKKEDIKTIPWSVNLDAEDFHQLVETLNGYSSGIGLEDGYVECSTYWMINKSNNILGVVHIRHRLNEPLLYRGGHIGYAIIPSERRKGYATKMLSLALDVCKAMGISKVLITCAKDNIGSAKTIINNGGILDSEGIDEHKVFQRYWIELSKNNCDNIYS
jgi:predicted acetyltransferase